MRCPDMQLFFFWEEEERRRNYRGSIDLVLVRRISHWKVWSRFS